MAISTVTATIPARGSISGNVAVSGAIVGIIMPPVWTPAVVTAQVSSDGVNFYDLYDGMAATELSFNVKPNTVVSISPSRLDCCVAIRLRSGTSAKPVAQTIACQFGLVIQGP